jgi:hypothetical protein
MYWTTINIPTCSIDTIYLTQELLTLQDLTKTLKTLNGKLIPTELENLDGVTIDISMSIETKLLEKSALLM